MAVYIYILLQNPNWIFVTDRASVAPYKSLAKVTEKLKETGPVYNGPEKIFEPCSHFVDHVIWRGPKNYKGQSRYNIKVVSSHSVFHVLDTCHKQDVHPQVQKDSFDNEAPIPYIMPGKYGAVDFNNILVSGKNAWPLVASLITGNNSKTNWAKEEFHINQNREGSSFSDNSTNGNYNITQKILLNLMVQRILWESDVTIGFIPSNPSFSPSKRACRSCDVFSQINAIDKKHYKALLDWKCDSFLDVESCFLHLAANTTCSNISLKQLVHIWIFLLKEYKIQNYPRVPLSVDKLNEKRHGIPLYFSPTGLVKNDTMRLNPFRNMCKSHDRPYHSVIPEKYPISNILLIIVFNFPFLVSHIPLLDYVYGRHYKHVLYCSENIAEFEQRYQRLHPERPVNWIEIKHYMGYWGQNCMSAAIKMGYDVKGYLQISDDVIMNVWNLDNLPYNQPWFQSNMKVAHIDREIVPDVWINNYWWPWTQFSGKKSAVAAFNQLEAMLSSPEGDRISSFMENIYNITNCDRCFLYEASDIFYLPSELGANFTFFSDIFSYNKVFLEITIPTVLAGITSDKEVYRLRGNYLWFHDRDRYPYVYTEFDHFYHAWKLSRFGDAREIQFFCRHFLSKIDKHLILKGSRTDA